MDTQTELFLTQVAFGLYVWLHIGAKVRRFLGDLAKKRRARKRAGRGWF